MHKKRIITILLGVLILLSILVLLERQKLNREKRENVLGTYCTTYCTNESQPNEYYVLQADGNYIKYQEFKILEQGTFLLIEVYDDARIITLSGGIGENHLLHVNGRLYEFTQGGMIAIYEKISETSLYINI